MLAIDRGGEELSSKIPVEQSTRHRFHTRRLQREGQDIGVICWPRDQTGGSIVVPGCRLLHHPTLQSVSRRLRRLPDHTQMRLTNLLTDSNAILLEGVPDHADIDDHRLHPIGELLDTKVLSVRTVAFVGVGVAHKPAADGIRLVVSQKVVVEGGPQGMEIQTRPVAFVGSAIISEGLAEIRRKGVFLLTAIEEREEADVTLLLALLDQF